MIYVIMGFLMMKKLTKYDIKRVLSREISPFYASSYGSINNAIKKLLALKYIGYTEVTTDGRHKKIYFLLDLGKESFMSWVKEDIVIGKYKDGLSLKMFFYGFLTIQERLERLEIYYIKQQENYQGYSNNYQEVSKTVYPKEVAEIASCQIMTLDYAKHHLECDLKWLEREINNLKEKLND